MDLSSNGRLQSLVLKVSHPARIWVSAYRLADISVKLPGETVTFSCGSPWGNFSDFLVNRETRSLVGLAFEANDKDKLSAYCLHGVVGNVVEFPEIAHTKYPEDNIESAFLEISWSVMEANEFAAAQCDNVFFGYTAIGVPDFVAVDDLDIYLTDYSLRLPLMSEWKVPVSVLH